MSWVSKSNESKRSPVCPSAGRMVNSRRRSEAMMKRVMIAAVVALGLSGCATMQGLTPCEKAILAKYAADKIIDSVCPLASRSEEHTSELQSLMRISYAVFCLKKNNNTNDQLKYDTEHTVNNEKNTITTSKTIVTHKYKDIQRNVH